LNELVPTVAVGSSTETVYHATLAAVTQIFCRLGKTVFAGRTRLVTNMAMPQMLAFLCWRCQTGYESTAEPQVACRNIFFEIFKELTMLFLLCVIHDRRTFYYTKLLCLTFSDSPQFPDDNASETRES
jgi:hypothetical protein